MDKQFRIFLAIAAFLITVSITGITAAAGLTNAWKESPVAEGSFFNVVFSADGSTVYAGGNQMLVRSWDGTTRWGGESRICRRHEL